MLKRLALLLFALPVFAQVPAPQINLTGNIGCQGFPCFNNGSLNFVSDANRTMTAQESSVQSPGLMTVTSSISLTATRNLIAPSGQFLFTIKNATMGGQSIQIGGASGASVGIPNGQTVIVANGMEGYYAVGSQDVFPSVQSQTYPGMFAGVNELLPCPSNPILTNGTTGHFDAGSLRDNVLFKAKSKLWTIYTGALTDGGNYNPTLGIAYTSDVTGGCTGWTKGGQIVAANTTSGQWNSGAIFSPGVYCDTNCQSGSGTIYLYISATVLPVQWYSGPSCIGILSAAASADWTNPASWTYTQNSCAVSMGDPWESVQGVYAPYVIYNGSQFVMYYSSNSGNGNTYYVGLATASSPSGPFTKLPATSSFDPIHPTFPSGHNPIAGDGLSEEPSISQLDNGGCLMTTDNLDFSQVGFKTFYTSDQTCINGWTQLRGVDFANPPAWFSTHLGSDGTVEMSPGKWLFTANGANPNGNTGDEREIGFFQMTFKTSTASAHGTQGVGTETGWNPNAWTISNRFLDSCLDLGPASTVYFDLCWNIANSKAVLTAHNYQNLPAFPLELYFSYLKYSGGFLNVSNPAFPGRGGFLTLGDETYFTKNVGVWRGQQNNVTVIGDSLNLDAYAIFSANVGPSAFGAKLPAIACSTSGCRVGPKTLEGSGSVPLAAGVRFGVGGTAGDKFLIGDDGGATIPYFAGQTAPTIGGSCPTMVSDWIPGVDGSLYFCNNGTWTYANAPLAPHSYYASILPTAFATNTVIGPVYLDSTATTPNIIIARLSGTISCTAGPQVSWVDLGTSPTTTYSSSSPMITVAASTTDGVYTNSSEAGAMTPGHYYGFATTAGTCVTFPQIDVTVQVQ